MTEIEMPPQYAGEEPDPNDTEGHVGDAVQTMVAERVDSWTTFALAAVDEFESNARLHIDELVYDYDVTYSFDPILVSFGSVIMEFFPEAKVATSAIATVMDGIQSSYHAKESSGLAGAKLRLSTSVAALVQAARERTEKAIVEIKSNLKEIVQNAMTWVDSASTDLEYVGALCDWMGFPVATRENTVNPVRQALENPFFGVYQAVRAQLLLAHGVPGLTEEQLNPVAWEHDGVARQRELYRLGGPDAWKESYDESRNADSGLRE